jgi:hypothetical protein
MYEAPRYCENGTERSPGRVCFDTNEFVRYRTDPTRHSSRDDGPAVSTGTRGNGWMFSFPTNRFPFRKLVLTVSILLVMVLAPQQSMPVSALEKSQEVIYFPLSGRPGLGHVNVIMDGSESLGRQALNLADMVLKHDESGLGAGLFIREAFILTNGTAVLDIGFRPGAAGTAGVLEEYQVIWSLVNTLTVNMDAIRAVKVLVEGNESPSLFGHVDLSCPFHFQSNPVPGGNQ